MACTITEEEKEVAADVLTQVYDAQVSKRKILEEFNKYVK